MTIRRKKLPISALEKIDDLCAEFERRWQTDQPQTIESALSADLSADEAELLLSELLALEIDYRRRNGDIPAEAEYVSRFPDRTQIIKAAFGTGRTQGRGFEPPEIEEISRLFPSLEVLSVLGVGGMGAVYKVRQKGLNRVVALKILPEEFGHDVKFALRFTREARTLARLNHPNIVSVFEFGNAGDVYYFLMEFVDGPTLRQVVQNGQLAPEEALAIVPHLCDALQYAHDHGIVHRDIKPENILVAADGSVKIADFGLSRIVGGTSAATALTQTHQVLGTPRYMAPEQFEGSRKVDHRADIYSLGVVFYEMLTGELPVGRFEAPSQKVSIDVRLDEVVLRTLEKEPQRRYQAASEIKSDLHSIASLPGHSIDHSFNPNADISDANKQGLPVPSLNVGQQANAASLLISRRHILDRIRESLRSLRNGQIIQILIGIVFIIIGSQCWATNINVPHKLICGLLVHVYGIVVIGAGAHVWTRIARMNYSKPVSEVRKILDNVRGAYLLGGPLVGLPWWFLWIPLSVAIGADAVLHPYCLWPALVIGIAGFALIYWFHRRTVRKNQQSNGIWHKDLIGNRLYQAYLTLDEMETAGIE
ncbi:MAG: serine/threonine-protein kinase [Planctomycetota bacterium]